MKRHPMQPLVKDQHGVVRFQANKIIQFLFDSGCLDLNQLATMEFCRADREQIAQLLGYSVGGFAELSYVRDATYERAVQAQEKLERK